MKVILVIVISMLLFSMPVFAQEAKDFEPGEVAVAEVSGTVTAEGNQVEVFNVFTEKWAEDNHYCPSGWMGDYGDIQLDDNSRDNPHSGTSCLKITYNAKGAQNAGWMGIFWQNPPNNWGDQMGGYDLTGYNKVTFWARGQEGGEIISEFKVGGINGMYFDSDSTSIGPITLTKDWKQYEIPLKGLDLSYISGGFCFSARASDNPQGFTLYLDDIKYEK